MSRGLGYMFAFTARDNKVIDTHEDIRGGATRREAFTSLWQLVQLLLRSNRPDSWLTTFTS
jgi:hypothetical protein